MTRRQFAATAMVPFARGMQWAARPANMVYFLLDDLGMYDLGGYGSKQIQTPNIDRLAAAGAPASDPFSLARPNRLRDCQ